MVEELFSLYSDSAESQILQWTTCKGPRQDLGADFGSLCRGVSAAVHQLMPQEALLSLEKTELVEHPFIEDEEENRAREGLMQTE